MKPPYKNYLLLIFLIALAGSAGSFFAQYVLNLNPCPLCIFQRVAVICVAVVTCVCLLFPLRFMSSCVISTILITLPAAFGMGVALRQIYLQSLPPDQVPACGPGLNFMIKTMPFSDMLSTVLTGSGECAKVEKILSIPLPVWSALLFGTVLLLLWYALIKNRRYHPFGY